LPTFPSRGDGFDRERGVRRSWIIWHPGNVRRRGALAWATDQAIRLQFTCDLHRPDERSTSCWSSPSEPVTRIWSRCISWRSGGGKDGEAGGV